jgi:hypothetical protein
MPLKPWDNAAGRQFLQEKKRFAYLLRFSAGQHRRGEISRAFFATDTFPGKYVIVFS